MERPRLRTLTSLRFLAALPILFHHTWDRLAAQPSWLTSLPFPQAVSLFFVLSGFILTYSYPSLKSTKEEIRFLVARVARIWPLHLFCLLILVVAAPISSLADHPNELRWILPLNLMMVHAWVPNRSAFLSLNGPSWSISCEFFFYLCFPLLIRDWKNTWLVKLILAFFLVALMIVYGNWIGISSDPHDIFSAAGLAYINPGVRLFEFVLGMAGSVLWIRTRKFTGVSTAFATCVEVFAVGLTLSTCWLMGRPMGVPVSAVLGPTGLVWLEHSGPCFVFVLLISLLAHGRGWISRALSWRVLVGLGEISYSIFLLHRVVLKVVDGRFPSLLVGMNAIGLAALWLAIILLSYCTWRLIEIPARRWLRSKTHFAESLNQRFMTT